MANEHPTPTTARSLLSAIQKITPASKPLPGYENRIVSRFPMGMCMDECYPGLYIGDLGAAKNKDYLKQVGITHVVNTAQGNKFATVDTDEAYYTDVGIKYLGMKLLDVPTANIAQYFEAGADFIDEALSSGGRVLVHCFMGISRSATIACAFLMLKRRLGAQEALETLRKNRSIYPNDGFLNQLADLDNKLRKERGEL
ncbi:dual specificity protein phosphatase 3-like [Penaeus chinensis]|uniref:dual specificity protein phosphatase 3-like n=1 Tax=Penaeus chinensis TaxID=139456 RepID=UPI001FB84193|nr:dual specificity protein phosphatase 3-like [Penaeus chinensis]XP_047494728.1 dual specificity protein phosphatase 3-like [Penaeus chinensis]XP_047494729.1 dual specificity protein phosphatase 3-like [Penaeus chinensis]XP_047494730.1 dual specificity protein phosphatase 3-like [Penaeus chinensis]XP_047494731.1 dual specificity protein phosphatase 3-like [Penaeus chinensis]XP_047494732.1 dual specificity protein phosphatase 3-like [Penaeus chinensis]XP_047494733.1 dual specificity protein p